MPTLTRATPPVRTLSANTSRLAVAVNPLPRSAAHAFARPPVSVPPPPARPLNPFRTEKSAVVSGLVGLPVNALSTMARAHGAHPALWMVRTAPGCAGLVGYGCDDKSPRP